MSMQAGARSLDPAAIAQAVKQLSALLGDRLQTGAAIREQHGHATSVDFHLKLSRVFHREVSHL